MRKILSIIFIGVFLFAADYGKINGKVVDSETGEPLVGADIIVEGTELGAASDEKGDFNVLYVPAGTYTVVASYISYDPLTYARVVVNADQTTLLNFRLRPTVIEQEVVEVIAERPLVVVSKTGTDRAVTRQEMDRLPVTTINKVITLQAGVVQSDRGTHIRGGREEELTYFVDGIVTKNPHYGTQSVSIHPSAVEEVTVISGGFDAEYGEALSGIVNVVTKEGGAKISGNFHYLTDEMFTGMEALNWGYNLYELSFGGPIPMVNRLRYFLSGELLLTDSYESALYKTPSPRMDYKAQARFSYHFPNAKGKVTVSGFKAREQWMRYGPGMSPPTSQLRLKYFNKIMDKRNNMIASASFNYMLTARTLTSLKVGITEGDRVWGTRDFAWEDSVGRTWYEDYRMLGEHLIPYLDKEYLEDNNLTIRDVLVDSVKSYHTQYQMRDVLALRTNPYGVEAAFYTYGDYRYWRYWYNSDIQGRFDISHQAGKIHEFKTGFDYTQYHMKHYDNGLTYAPNPFWDYLDRKPYKFATYLQDKMDFEGLIARLGVRFDYFDAKAFTFAHPNDWFNDEILESEANYKISPRLGFSLPITERMKLRFNYGHYFQVPSLTDLYESNDTAVVRVAVSRGNTRLGNVLLNPQKTVQYELGIENQFTDDVAVGFTAYFKDIYDLAQVRLVEALPMAYYKYENVDYGNVKGFEFSLKKRMSDMWATGLSYTLQFAKGTAAYAGEWYMDHYYYQIEPPVIDYWLDFDERHIVNANFDVETPEDFAFIPLQNFASSFVFSFHSGRPYTPEDLKGNKLGDENSARIPGFWNVDWSFSRRIPAGTVNFVVDGIIDNLFNTEQITEVYPFTGRADDHGDPEPDISQFGPVSIASARYSPQADYNHDGLMSSRERKQAYMASEKDYYTNPDNYLDPFRVRFGIGIGF
jgi:outer membrane receptor protein involved in Fe transport